MAVRGLSKCTCGFHAASKHVPYWPSMRSQAEALGERMPESFYSCPLDIYKARHGAERFERMTKAGVCDDEELSKDITPLISTPVPLIGRVSPISRSFDFPLAEYWDV